MFKPTDVEREVIVCAFLQAQEPVSKLAEQLGRRDYTVRHALQRLTQEGIIQSFPIVNVYTLGLTDYGIYCRRSAESSKVQQDFVSHLINSPQLPWASVMGGDYQYAFSLSARHISEIDHFLTDLSKKHGKSTLEQVIAVRITWSYFRPDHIAEIDCPAKSLDLGGAPEQFSYDEVDLRILRTIADPKKCKGRALAAAVGLPESTVKYRLNRLEEAGVIVGYALAFDFQALGLQEYRLLVVVQGGQEGVNEKFYKFCLKHPNVVRYTRCIGPWSFEICIQVANQKRVIAVSQEIRDYFGDVVREIRVLAELDNLKRIPYPQLGA
jgi:DNA-binding Lrp family transcriptional regulator